MKRKILHVDMDAFFASVEQVDNPELRGKPIIVGGNSERGVVATCSYEARVYGVRSAMSSQLAKKLCPHAIFVRGRHSRYSQVSKQIFNIIEGMANVIEKVSIDEAYIDVTDLYQSPMFIAQEIKKAVYKATGLTVSVGISYNKFLAKLASDWNKPDGIFEIKEYQVADLLDDQPVIKVHGLGKKSVEKLNRIGIFTIRDLKKYSVDSLSGIFGEQWAKEVYNRIRGIDDRPVGSVTDRKSIGKETTFHEDSDDRTYLLGVLEDYLVDNVANLKRKNLVAKTVVIKVKYEDFDVITRSHSLETHTDDIGLFRETMHLIYDKIVFEKKVRLIGVTLSNVIEADAVQMTLFDFYT
jgi:DNA polymerase-4